VLSKEDNALLTQVGPGTPMGSLFREYWLPILISSELPEVDGPPVRVRILGEDLVAYRDTSRQVGLLKDKCAHRGAPLYYGRNEEHGLRCVYHGWKFDLTGRCIDMPSEAPESNFKDKVRQLAYPCLERSGVIWAYLGPRSEPPPFPALEWAQLPEAHHVAAKITENCNWLQVLEGDLDSVHSDFLHGQFATSNSPGRRDKNPRIELAPTACGFAKAARRIVDADHVYYRIYQFLMPAMVQLPAGRDTIAYRITVPIDDEHTVFWNGEYSPLQPLREETRRRHLESRAIGGFAPSTGDPLTRWRPLASPANDYFIDYEAQKTERFSGIPPVKLQDVAMTEGMGAILDRTQEHLGTTDAAIIRLRRVMLDAVKALRDHGTVPPTVDDPDAYAVRSGSVVLPPDQPWLEFSRPRLQVAPNQPLLSAAIER
jgi:phthalate 4,5-dioxygenase